MPQCPGTFLKTSLLPNESDEMFSRNLFLFTTLSTAHNTVGSYSPIKINKNNPQSGSSFSRIFLCLSNSWFICLLRIFPPCARLLFNCETPSNSKPIRSCWNPSSIHTFWIFYELTTLSLFLLWLKPFRGMSLRIICFLLTSNWKMATAEKFFMQIIHF